MSRETGNVSCIFMQICRFIGQKRRKETYEQHTCIKNTVSGRTGPDGYDHLRHGIYPTGILSDTGLSITFLTVPVAVGAMILGPVGGAICGLAFGITSFMQCFGMGAFGTMLFSINPLGTAFVCIVPRILEGWLTGLIFKAIRQKMKNGAYLVASLACPFLNTLFFMSALVLIFYHTDYIQGFVTSLGVSNPFTFVLAFVGAQGLIEAVVCFILAGAISRALSAALHRI